MSAKLSDELKEELRALPQKYENALEDQTQIFLSINKVEREIEKLESNQISTDDDAEVDLLDENDDAELIDLEKNLEKLKLKLAQIEYKVELDFRKDDERIRESKVKALVSTNEKVSQLREKLIEKNAELKAKKSDLKRQRQIIRETQRTNRLKRTEIVKNPELDFLQSQLIELTGKQIIATDKVETIKFQLEVFKLLIGMEERNRLDL